MRSRKTDATLMFMKTVTLYTTPTCAFCPAIKKLLDKADVDYTELDVSQDEKYLDEMKQISGQMGVPVTVVDDTVIIGYDKKKLLKAL